MPSGSGAMKMPWSVKGVDAQARDAAKDAARRAGMTLGEWLNTVIVETAADEPEPPRRNRPGHDLRDIADRLSRLDRAAADTAVSAHQAQTDLESVLRRTIADTIKRSDAVEERTAGALGAMVKWMERAEERRREEVGTIAAAQERTSTALRDALALVTTRMNDIERSITTRNPDPGVREALARLESRIDRLDERETAAPMPATVEKALRDLETRLVAVAGRVGGSAPEANREQAERIETIETALAAILDRLDMAGDDAGEDDDLQTDAWPAAPGSLDEAMAQIRKRQAMLDQPFPARRAPPPAPPAAMADRVVDALKGDIAQLSLRIDELREVTQRHAVRIDDRAVRDVAALRGDLADLTSAVKTLAPQTRLDAIETGLAALGSRLDDLRRENGSRALSGPLESIGAEMGRIGAALEPLRGLADLRADIAALGRRLDRTQSNPDPDALAAITAGIEQVKSDVATALSGADAVAQLETRLASIDATLDRLSRASEGHEAGIAAITSAANGIRTAIAGLPSPDLGGVENRLKAIETRFDEAHPAALAAAQDIRDAIAGLQAPDLGALEGRLKSFEARFDDANPAALAAVQDIQAAIAGLQAPDLGSIETRLQDIIDRLDATPAPAATTTGTGELEALIRGLGEKIDAAGRAEATPASFEALERQIAAMTDALGRNDESLTSLRAMERSIADLFVRVEDGRLAVVEAAEAAAMKAAQTVSGAMPQSTDPRAVDALDAVQATLGRIVERLTRLEAGIEAQQQQAATLTLTPAVETEARPPQPSVAEKIAAAAAAARAAKQAEPARKSRGPAPPPAPTPDETESARQLVAAARASAEKAMQTLAAPQPAPDIEPVAPAAPELEPSRAMATEPVEAPQETATGSEPAEAAPKGEPTPAGQTVSFDDDRPLEPGTGRPVLPATPDVPADADAVTAEPEARKPSFIAAARAAVASRPKKSGRLSSLRPEREAPAEAPAADVAAVSAQVGGQSFLERKRRPILIGLAIVVLALGTAQVVRTMLAQRAAQPPVPAAETSSLPTPPLADPTATGAIPPTTLPGPAALEPPSSIAQPSFNKDARPAPPADAFAPPAREPEAVGALGKAPQATPAPALADPEPVATPVLNDIARALLPAGLQSAAKAGNAVAAYDIAVRLLDGKGVPRDPKAAAKWLEKAAAGGLAPAEYRLGSLYEKGTGVAVDLNKARALYLRAAEKGNAKAMHNLGVLVADSGSGKPDYVTAAAWFRRAADLGVRDSQYNLAILAARGLGMQQNLGESYVWFTIAAGQGDEDAARKRDEVAARLDAAALATAKAAAAGFQPRKPDDAANEVAMPATWEDQAPAPAAGKGKGRG